MVSLLRFSLEKLWDGKTQKVVFEDLFQDENLNSRALETIIKESMMPWI